jgi:hypothetical protein
VGFDLHGENPKDRVGRYFRASIWTWSPLWEYVTSRCCGVLSKRDQEQGYWNDGHLIGERKAELLAERLSTLVQAGDVSKYAKAHTEWLQALPLIVCERCVGTGTRNDQYVKGECNDCRGMGKRVDAETHFPFREDRLREFAAFCGYSGGFRIW